MSARNYVPAMVKWMVEEGTKNTSSGNWIFTSAEIADLAMQPMIRRCLWSTRSTLDQLCRKS